MNEILDVEEIFNFARKIHFYGRVYDHTRLRITFNFNWQASRTIVCIAQLRKYCIEACNKVTIC